MDKKKGYNRQYFKDKFTTEDPWRFWSSPYEQMKYQRQLAFIKEYCPSPREILEVGCSEGAFTKMLRDNFLMARITGVDISSKAVQKGRKKVKNTTFIVGDILNIVDRLAKDNFDVIIMSEIIYYLGANIDFVRMYKFLRKIKDLLKKQGILITANVVDFSDTPKMFIVKQPIIESYYTLLAGLFVLIDGKDYKDYKKEEKQEFNYGIRIFRKI